MTLDTSALDRISNADSEAVFRLRSVLPVDVAMGLMQRESVGLADRPNRFNLPAYWMTEMSVFRQRPETVQLFRDLKLPAYWDLYGWPPMCRRIEISEVECD